MVPEDELRLLSAFDLLASLLVIALSLLSTVATTIALYGTPWSAVKIGTFTALVGAILGLGAWLVWGWLMAGSMLRRIKRRSKRKTNGDGNGSGAATQATA
ncbi:MAG: hypothetical protein OXD30_14235 [Bryobacterales bacterium]|nr:hypothetical protein [Bryobacterales bacterium]